MSYQYDLASNRTKVTYPATLFVDYTYDNLNRMKEVRENGATSGAGLLAVYSYDVLSRRTGITRGNGTATTYPSYDPASRLLSLAHNLSGTTQDLTLNFSYTDASQLSARATSNTLYDWAVPTVNRAYVPDGLNRYTSVAGTTYGYDANGNLTSDGARTLTYDVENRLRTVTGGAGLTLSYDPRGRLRQTVSGATTTQFLYDGDRLVAEYNAAGTLQRRYVHGAGMDEPLTWYEGSTLTDRRHLHADERGSVIAWSNSSGAGTLYRYGPYGEPDVWTGARFRYTGQIALLEASLYHYKARVYDPGLGRFLQTDPVGYQDDVNLYTYVYNDPLNRTDPTGEFWVTGLVSAGLEFTVQAIEMTAGSRTEYELGDIVTAGIAGATGFGLAKQINSLGRVSNLARVGLETAADVAVSAGSNAAKGELSAEGVVADVIGGRTAGSLAGSAARNSTLRSPANRQLDRQASRLERNARNNPKPARDRAAAEARAAQSQQVAASSARASVVGGNVGSAVIAPVISPDCSNPDRCPK